MIHKKRLFYLTALAVLICGALALAVHAENPPEPNNDPPRPQHGPPPMPLFDALDTNHDGIISADEITNATAALKSLLKNGATQLTREDVRPPAPAHRPPPRDGQTAGEATPPRTPRSDDRADRPRHWRPRPDADEGADRPHHRPPSPDDGSELDDDSRPWPHPRMDDGEYHPHHRPPPPPRDDD